jgi:hypothetical protein
VECSAAKCRSQVYLAVETAQAVQMSNRYCSQPRVLLLVEELNFAFKNAPRCRTLLGLVRLLYAVQQFDVGSRVALGKAARMAWPPAFSVAVNQPR